MHICITTCVNLFAREDYDSGKETAARDTSRGTCVMREMREIRENRKTNRIANCSNDFLLKSFYAVNFTVQRLSNRLSGAQKNESKTFSIDAGCCIHLQMQWIKFNNIAWGHIFQLFPLRICYKTFLVWTFNAFIAGALCALQLVFMYVFSHSFLRGMPADLSTCFECTFERLNPMNRNRLYFVGAFYLLNLSTGCHTHEFWIWHRHFVNVSEIATFVNSCSSLQQAATNG